MTAADADWAKRLGPYRLPDNRRAAFEIALTAVPFLAAWIVMWLLLQVSVWLALLASIPAAGFLVRLFMIQHDCGHGSLFSAQSANDWTGRVISVLTLTPYDLWRRSHALHHASSGNLDRRGIGDINTITVAEYRALGRWGRLRYRFYRHPLVMFGLGPAYLFLLQHRLPVGAMQSGRMPWISAFATNAAIAAAALCLIWLVGWKAFLLIQLPVTLLAASAGVWLFFVQHQFEETYWAKSPDWQRETAALHGSSYYDLPKPLMWLTGYIGVHHLHHLSSRIPFWRLPYVLRDYPELKTIGRLTLLESFRCVRLVLWCEAEKRLISFREMRRRERGLASGAAA